VAVAGAFEARVLAEVVGAGGGARAAIAATLTAVLTEKLVSRAALSRSFLAFDFSLIWRRFCCSSLSADPRGYSPVIGGRRGKETAAKKEAPMALMRFLAAVSTKTLSSSL
jgi:hypothetical protein